MKDRENRLPQQPGKHERKYSGYFAGLFGATLGLISLVCGFIEIVRLIK
jgi:hypothetical protein